MTKLKDKSSEVQFVYEEDDSKSLLKVQDVEISDEELSGLEFAAATKMTDNPLLNTNQESDELNSSVQGDLPANKQVELSEEAKKQKTATVLHIDRGQLANNSAKDPSLTPREGSGEIKIVTESTRDSIKPQSLDKAQTSTPALKVVGNKVSAPAPVKATATAQALPQPQVKAVEKEVVRMVEDQSTVERIHQIETHAEVRIALAEFKAEFLAEHLGEAKALEYQIKQLLKPLVKANNEAMNKQIQKVYALLEGHSKGTIELVKGKAQAEKIVKPTQDKANKVLAQTNEIKKAG